MEQVRKIDLIVKTAEFGNFGNCVIGNQKQILRFLYTQRIYHGSRSGTRILFEAFIEICLAEFTFLYQLPYIDFLTVKNFDMVDSAYNTGIDRVLSFPDRHG